MHPVLVIVALVVFATSLFARCVDPVIPPIALDFGREPATVALLSSAFAIPYALVQPALGAISDVLGKTRLMTICMVMVIISATACAIAPSFETLLVARIATGIAAGGILPVSLAMAGDYAAVSERAIVIGRLLIAAMAGNLLGASSAGIIGDAFGWRMIFIVTAALSAPIFAVAYLGFRRHAAEPRASFDLRRMARNYQEIFRNPLTKVCLSLVFLEGVLVHGLFPHMANLLVAIGETRASIAGIIIAGFGIGGMIYGATVSLLLARMSAVATMWVGSGLVAASQLAILLWLPWPFQVAFLAVMGFAFYMLHANIQVFATELAPHARGSAVSLHSACYFFGMGVGPIFYGYGLSQIGTAPTVVIAAVGVMFIGFACMRWLQLPGRGDQPRPR